MSSAALPAVRWWEFWSAVVRRILWDSDPFYPTESVTVNSTVSTQMPGKGHSFRNLSHGPLYSIKLQAVAWLPAHLFLCSFFHPNRSAGAVQQLSSNGLPNMSLTLHGNHEFNFHRGCSWDTGCSSCLPLWCLWQPLLQLASALPLCPS